MMVSTALVVAPSTIGAFVPFQVGLNKEIPNCLADPTTFGLINEMVMVRGETSPLFHVSVLAEPV